MRVRIWADDQHRVGAIQWKSQVRRQVEEVSRFLAAGFGVRLEVESLRTWERPPTARVADLGATLAELEKHDPGADVDWVVGLTAALPLATNSMHEIGMARSLGRHFVMRSMASLEETRVFQQGLHLLSVEERERLFVERKRHKEITVWLHEWAHTLGAIHSSEPEHLMNPSYSPRRSSAGWQHEAAERSTGRRCARTWKETAIRAGSRASATG
jgi:hypothetical protein